jgi:transposase
VVFTDEPDTVRKVWLFSLVLGYSRLIWARFVAHQELQSVLRCHMAAFAALGGVPRQIVKRRAIGTPDRHAKGALTHFRCNSAFTLGQ